MHVVSVLCPIGDHIHLSHIVLKGLQSIKPVLNSYYDMSVTILTHPNVLKAAPTFITWKITR